MDHRAPVAGKHFVLIERVGITAVKIKVVHSIGAEQAAIFLFPEFDTGAASRICWSH
jgi:hypothetical protein